MKQSQLIDSIDHSTIKKLNLNQLTELAKEIREFLIDSVKKTGGHLSSNLGVVELTIALYYSFNPPSDRFIFDVSHQAYVHKILSGRKNAFLTIRQENGLSGFTNPSESDFDNAQLGHAGTAISIAMGIQKSHMIMHSDTKDCPFTVAIVGDASIPNGVAFEALNNIGHASLKKLVIILNDNQMSISETVGGFSNMLTKIISHPFYNNLKLRTKKLLHGTKSLQLIAYRIKKALKKAIYHSSLFEDLGLRYIGPIDGHDLKALTHILTTIKTSKDEDHTPILLHVITKKGKGEPDSEDHPEKYHGIPASNYVPVSNNPIFTKIIEKKIVDMQEKYGNITASTAAMKQGTGLLEFSKRFPDHFFDLGIAESHAVAFSSFLSRVHFIKPYIAIYSTFLQRAIDQIFQEVILQQGLHPVFLIDRAGFVGEDGVTHHGLYDIAYLKTFPGAVLMSPKSQEELEEMMEFSYHQQSPIFIRYPKAPVSSKEILKTMKNPIILGKSEFIIKKQDAQFSIITYGTIIDDVLDIINDIPPCNIINLRFAKPLDFELLNDLKTYQHPIMTIEEHMIIGGVGESIASYLNQDKAFKSYCVTIGIEDKLFAHASRESLLSQAGLKGQSLVHNILKAL